MHSKGMYGSMEAEAPLCINMHIGVHSVLGDSTNSLSRQQIPVWFVAQRGAGMLRD